METQQQLFSFIESAPLAVLIAEPSGRIERANARAELMFGYCPGELLGKSIEDLIPERFRGQHQAQRGRYVQHPKVRPMGMGMELVGLRKDGTEFPVEIALGPVRLGGEIFTLTFISDISERKQLQLRERQAGVLEERHRLARELHDTVAQSVAAIICQLGAAQELLKKFSVPDSVRDLIDQARYTARGAYEDARSSLLVLHRAAPEGSLLDWAQRVVEEMARGATALVRVGSEGQPFELPQEIEYDLLRICQQAVRNALRHAAAREVRVDFVYTPEEVRLQVVDDGRGFDPAAPRKSFGLTSMRERAANAGGSIEVRSSPGQGTRVEVVIPAPRPEPNADL